MKQEIDPKKTSRAYAFEMWTKSPQPMVTMVKTFDVTHLRRQSRRRGMKFNMLLCWCIGRAASQIEELYMLPTQGKLYKYDSMGINVIVNNAKGGINTCDVPYSDDLEQFARDYDTLTKRAAEDCCEIPDEERIIIGTSAVMGTELDCIVNQYTGIFNNPFLAWSRYRRHWFRYRLTISLQFHHAQMDGSHAARFLEELQKTMKTV